MARKKTDLFVKESNEIARAEILPAPRTVWAERVIACFASFIHMHMDEFPESAFMIGRVADKKLSAADFRAIEKEVTSLGLSGFRVRHGQQKFTTYPIFEFLHYDTGILSGKFNKAVKPFYLQLTKRFAVRSLAEFNSLSSTYSQVLYRTLHSWSGLSETTIPLAELHRITGAPASLRQNFKAFRTRALEPAHKEITAKTSLQYDWEPVKEGRKVIAVRFVFFPVLKKPLSRKVGGIQRGKEKK